MKDSQILKMLKKEVSSIVPTDCLQRVKSKNITPEKNASVQKEMQEKTRIKSRWTLVFACCMIIVVAAMICMPFIINSRDGASNNLSQNQQETESPDDEENTDN